MTEADKASFGGKEHDVLQFTSQEEAQRFKQTYSQPRKRWTVETLYERFPADKRTGNIFVADNGMMQRFFQFYTVRDVNNEVIEEYAHEVSRVAYDPDIPRENPFSILWRDESRYDRDGYLIYYASVVATTYKDIPIKERYSYQQHYEYDIVDNKKVLTRVIEQPIAKTLDLRPASLIGQPIPYDFTNVPLGTS